MSQVGKFIVTEDGLVDLGQFLWDDHLFAESLQKDLPVELKQALDISQSVRNQVFSADDHTITMPLIDKMVKNALTECGLAIDTPIRLRKSIFNKNGLIFSDNAKRVLERRYLKKNANNEITETPAHMFRRVARHIASAEKNYADAAAVSQVEETFYQMMTQQKFLPNSPTLMNAGRKLGQLAACFVLPVEDSLDKIFDSLKCAALIHKSGGGTGFSFTRLRPRNSNVGSTGGVASGPVSFMKIFNTATEQVKQGGTRRGANMGVLRVDHPDIMEFIYSKRDSNDLNNFNISVAITDKFMKALAKNDAYKLIDPRSNKPVGENHASDVFRALTEQAWKNGDPGIIFIDRINKDNPTPKLGEMESTNPCGEQPLLPLEACNLGSINLALFLKKDEDGVQVDFEALKKLVWDAVRFLDNAIDKSLYPLPEIDQMVKGNRKVGLGVMGFADMLFQLNIPYNSEQAIETAEQVMGFIQTESHAASVALGKQRGAFKNFKESIYNDSQDLCYRNATTTTIAPTGTLSIIANCSSGIEPLFALSFVRNVMDNDQLAEVNSYFEKMVKNLGFYSPELMNLIAQKGSIKDIAEIPQEIRDVFVTAHDISPEWHIRMQASFQKYTDNAVSKTVNLPHDATVEDVAKIYQLAHELGCKGVTVYRDGSKENQVLSFPSENRQHGSTDKNVVNRPDTLEGFTTRVITGLGRLYVTVTELEGQPFEVFATIGKSGRSTTAKTEAIGRLISLALRSRVPVEKIVGQLKGIGGEHPVFQNGALVLSIPDAISRVLEERYLSNGNDKSKRRQTNSILGEKCPECQQTISFEEGCMKCHFCGFTKCG